MRRKLYVILEVHSGYGLVYDYFMILIVLSNIVPLCFHSTNELLDWMERVSVGVFILDYLLRWLTADLKFSRLGRKAFGLYPLTPFAVIDLLSILPVFALLNPSFQLLRLFRISRIFLFMKVFRYFRGFNTGLKVLRNEWRQLFSIGIFLLGYTVVSALVMFTTEPETFPSVLDAIYWAVMTLTSIGYGDFYPVSIWGKIFTSLSSIVGVAIIALPSAVITAGYMKLKSDNDSSETEEQENQKI